MCFTLVPFLMSFVLSFTNFNILSPDTKFIGLDNYVKLFTQDKLFIKSLKVTFKFAFISVPLRLIFALFVAMILNRKSRAVPVYRVVYYLPSIIGGSVAVSVMWRNLFTKAGVINSLLQAVGIDCRFKLAVQHQDSAVHPDFTVCLAVRLFHADLFVRPQTNSGLLL